MLSERVTRPHVRANRPILIPSVPVSEGIEIRYGCQFISSLVRALAKLPGGLGRFLPCGLGSHMSRLRHLGWNQCSHGLSSRPKESCHYQCVEAVCGVLGYPKGFSFGTSGWHTEAPTLCYCGFFLPSVMVVERGRLLLRVFLLSRVVIWVKGSGLPERHVQVHFLMSFRIQGIQRRGDGKDCAPLPPKERG